MVSKLTTTPNLFNLDDEQLINKFVQGSNQLLASANMRLEVNGSLSQLSDRHGSAIAIGYLQSKPRSIVVKQSSAFLELIDRVLQEREFVLMGDAKQPGFIEYRHYVTPAGYRVWYTDPAILWKKWWPTERFQNKQRFNMDILVNIKDNWYPVQNISVNAGVFTIKTIAGQLKLQREDRVLWLAQNINKDSRSATDSTAIQPEGSDLNLPFTASLSQEFLSSSQTFGTAKSIANVAPPTNLEQQKSIAELEQCLQAAIKAKVELEDQLTEAKQRALIAEQRLQIAYKYLQQMGINPQDIYIKKG
jgi:hypothetical protein